MSFPDNPELFRTPSDFAGYVIDGELDDDEISGQLSNLLGFARNFFLQFFDFEYQLQITDLNTASRRLVRPLERRLRESRDARADLRLISQFVTIVEFLSGDTGSRYGGPSTADRRRRILDDVGELLERIANWSDGRDDLRRVAAEARDVAEAFQGAAEMIDSQLGYDDD